MQIEPFRIAVPDSVLTDLRERLARTRFPDEIPNSGWGYGANLAAVRELVTYWRDAYDWRKAESALNGFAQFKAKGYDPEGYTLYTYAAIQAWAEAATKAKSIKTADVAKTLRGNKYKTVIGTLDFNDKGDVVNPLYVFYEWKDGKYDEIRPGT